MMSGLLLSGLLAFGSLFPAALLAQTKTPAAQKPTPPAPPKPSESPGRPAANTEAPGRSPASTETIDRVVAVVNDEQILLSEVQEQMAMIQQSQQLDLRDSSTVARLQGQVLDQLIEEKLIVDYATKQKITITDEQVDAKVDEMLNDIRTKLGSQEAFDKELKNQGVTVAGLKERYRQDVRRQMMAQRIIDREIKSKVKVTPADVDTFYRNNKEKFPGKPEQFHLAHILVTPKPDANRRAAARAKANDVLNQLEHGGNFDQLAEKYSDDKQNGGDLGEVEEGSLDEDFESGIHDLQPGQHSGLVETRFGFHIVQLLSRTGTRYHAKHILIRAIPTPTDVAASIERADKARQAAQKGTDWTTLVNSYSDDKDTKDKAGDLGMVPASALPEDYVATLDSLKVNGISPVLQGPTGYHVFKMLGKEAGRTYTLDEIREDLTNELTRMKLSEEYDRWMAGVRKKAFIEIKS